MAPRRLMAVALGLVLSQALLPACSTTGSTPPAAPARSTSPPPPVARAPGGSGNPSDPTDPAYDPGGDPSAGAGAQQQPPIQTGPSIGQRATSALNGMLMGAIIGGQAGPFGAAAGAAILLVYSAITGDVPLSGGGGHGGYGYPGGGFPGGSGYPSGQERDREKALEDQIQNEEQRQASLESEIDEELARQEDLLKKIDRQSGDQSAKVAPGPGTAPTEQELREQADPRAAPGVPKERDLPASVYQEQKLTISPGKWGNDRPLDVRRRTLDADRDGKPEEILFVDAKSGQVLRKESDLDYDGTIDAWSVYQHGQLVTREVDSDRDGKVDAWEVYAGGRMQSREVDRNGDGVRDAFFRYDGDSLVEERHDSNNDGQIDLVITYASRHRVRSEEDANKDGRLDTWTSFGPGDGAGDVITRIERDQKGTGKADTFETYVQLGGKTVISTREEDVNGDGTVDVKSSYENGKLKNREISDPSVVPM